MLGKLAAWMPANLLGLLGILQAVVKVLKEVTTLVIDLLLPVIPGDKFDNVVYKIRDIFNAADKGIEKVKDFFSRMIN